MISTKRQKLSTNFEQDLKNARTINIKISTVFECTSPFYTRDERVRMGIDNQYGGITGSITPSSFMRFFKVLQESPELMVIPNESVFCDIGSGMGRPSLTAALFPFKACLGFDIDNIQVQNSINAQRVVQKQKGSLLISPVKFFQMDARMIRSLNPTTHAYAFIGYENMIYEVARFVLETTTLKVLCIVVVKSDGMYSSGLLGDEDLQHVVFTGMKMSSGRSYTGYLIPISQLLKDRIKLSLSTHKWEMEETPYNFLEI